MEETTEVITTITSHLSQNEIERLIIDWLDNRLDIKWDFDFDFDFDARGTITVKVTRKTKRVS